MAAVTDEQTSRSYRFGCLCMKNIFVKDIASLTEGASFDGFFLVAQKQTRMTKNIKPYLVVTLSDKSC